MFIAHVCVCLFYALLFVWVMSRVWKSQGLWAMGYGISGGARRALRKVGPEDRALQGGNSVPMEWRNMTPTEEPNKGPRDESNNSAPLGPNKTTRH